MNIFQDTDPIIDYAIELLKEGIQHEELAVRFATAEVLAHFQCAQGEQVLLQCYKNSNPAVRERAVIALGNLKKASVIPAIQDSLRDDDPGVRGHAIQSLALAAEPEQAITAISAGLQDVNALVQQLSMEAAHGLENQAGIQILEALLTAKQYETCAYPVKITAAYRLAQSKNTVGQQFLKSMLENTDTWIAFLAAKHLAMISDPSGLHSIQQMLSQGHLPEKIMALEALIHLGIKANVVQELYRYSQENIQPLERVEIIRLLDHFAPQNTLELLQKEFQTKDEPMKIRILEVLGELRRPELVEIGEEILKIGPEHLRATLLMSIEKIGAQSLIECLIPMLERSYWLLRLQAARVILKLAGYKVMASLPLNC